LKKSLAGIPREQSCDSPRWRRSRFIHTARPTKFYNLHSLYCIHSRLLLFFTACGSNRLLSL